MFDKERFIHDCINALPDGAVAIRELVQETVGHGAALFAELGIPKHAGITPLYRSPQLTIINFVWAPCMNLMPHNHQMFAVIGIYSGREDNILWRRSERTIEAVGARSLGAGDVAMLDDSSIHSVTNPISKMTCALHVYGGDFFHPSTPRSEWDHESLSERPWDIDNVKALFRDAEARFECSGRTLHV